MVVRFHEKRGPTTVRTRIWAACGRRVGVWGVVRTGVGGKMVLRGVRVACGPCGWRAGGVRMAAEQQRCAGAVRMHMHKFVPRPSAASCCCAFRGRIEKRMPPSQGNPQKEGKLLENAPLPLLRYVLSFVVGVLLAKSPHLVRRLTSRSFFPLIAEDCWLC